MRGEHINQPRPINAEPSLRHILLAYGSAALIGLGVASPANTQAAETKPLPTPEQTTSTGYNTLAKDPNKIPSDIQRHMSKNTLYLKELSCSGQAIRGKNGTIIGALTAEHCGLRTPIIRKTAEGKQYIVQPQPVTLRTGATRGTLKRRGTITQWILPKTYDQEHDVALGVAKGHTVKEVLNAYKRSTLTPEEISKLKPGTDVYMSGWPMYKPKHTGKTDPRESFRMSYMSRGRTNTDAGKTLNVAWASLPRNKDGSVCSFRASGSQGFIVKNGKVRGIGTLSVFQDLKMTVPGIAGAKEPTKRQLQEKDVAAFCGFDYTLPNAETHDIVNVVSSEKEIPGYVDPEAVRAYGERQLKNPNTAKTVVEGIVSILPQTEGGAASGGPIYIQDPVLVHDAVNQKTIVATTSPKSEDGLGMFIVDDNSVGSIMAYPKESGQLGISSEVFGITGYDEMGGSLIGSNGKRYGQALSTDTSLIPENQVQLENGAYVLKPLASMK